MSSFELDHLSAQENQKHRVVVIVVAWDFLDPFATRIGPSGSARSSTRAELLAPLLARGAINTVAFPAPVLDKRFYQDPPPSLRGFELGKIQKNDGGGGWASGGK